MIKHKWHHGFRGLVNHAKLGKMILVAIVNCRLHIGCVALSCKNRCKVCWGMWIDPLLIVPSPCIAHYQSLGFFFLKGTLHDSSIIFLCMASMLKSEILTYFALVSCPQLCILQMLHWLNFYVENIRSDHTIIGSSAKISKSLQLCFRIYCFLSLYH